MSQHTFILYAGGKKRSAKRGAMHRPPQLRSHVVCARARRGAAATTFHLVDDCTYTYIDQLFKYLPHITHHSELWPPPRVHRLRY